MAYKVHLLDSTGEIKTIIVFSGIPQKEEYIFTSAELENIHTNKIQIIWSSLKIYGDDTVKTAKEKITYQLLESAKHPHSFPHAITSINDIYLFSVLKEKINLVDVYQELTENENRPIRKEQYAQLLSNFGVSPFISKNNDNKEHYEYEDFIEAFNFTDPEISAADLKEFNIPIGFHSRIPSLPRDYTFVANPYTIIDVTQTQYSQELSKNPFKINENKTLLYYGNIIGDNLYCCIYRDVVEFSFKIGVNEEYIQSVYFPFRESSAAEPPITLLKLKKNAEKWRTIDSYHKLYEKTAGGDVQTLQNPNSLAINNSIIRGIKTISFCLSASKQKILPLESIFKEIHASEMMPYISFNPRVKKEIVLRLFSNEISKNGKKIPFLKYSELMKISRELKTSKTISFYAICHDNTATKIEIYIELHQNGTLSVKSTHPSRPLSVDEWNDIFRKILAPLSKKINVLLSQSGYSISEYVSFKENENAGNITILNIKYIEEIKINKGISLSGVNGLSEIFTIIGNNVSKQKMALATVKPTAFEDDLVKGVVLRFKRVDDFKENDEQTILITELFKRTTDINVIKGILTDNFNMNEADATERITKFITEHGEELENIEDSAGFPVIVQWHNPTSFNSVLSITVDEINALNYIPYLHLYINCILQINLNNSLKFEELVGKKGWTTHFNNMVPFVNHELVNEIIGNAETAMLPKKAVEAIQFVSDSAENETEMFDENYVDLKNVEKMDEKDEKNKKTNSFENHTENTDNKYGISDDFIDLEEEDEEDEENNNVNRNQNVKEPEEEEEPEEPEEEEEPEEPEESEDDFIDLEEESSENTDGDDKNNNNPPIQTGGQMTDKNLDGQPISFLERLQSREPTLFLSKKNGKYETYSRMCESNHKRQPVILTDEEKNNIDKNHPGSYSESLNYGTGTDKYWYICPRYWCLKTNTSLTEEEAKSGVCGGIIPKDATKIPSGSYVYEFDSKTKQHRDKDGNYINNNPGFLNTDSHPSGKCLPCCFKGSWNKPQQKKRREECSAQNTETQNPVKLTNKKKDVFYIIGNLTYPIELNRFGFLPISVQKMFQMDVSKFVSKTNPANIQPNKPCLVRFGVENSNTQSFLACFAEIYAYKQGHKLSSIAEFKEILAVIITLDDFIKYHNGSLISVFQVANGDADVVVTADTIQKFKETQLWKNTFDDINILPEEYNKHIQQNDTTDPEPTETDTPIKIRFFHKIASAYFNYLAYIKNPTATIDHTFLWDAFTDPSIMKGGVNLIILQIPNDDLTDNVEIICPTVSMSNKSFDSKKETVVLIKQEQFYEPIYLYTENDGVIHLVKSFTEKSAMKPIIKTMQTIKSLTKKYCSSQPSKPTIYRFKQNLPANEIYKILKNNDYRVQYQISNYQGKIIGLYVTYFKEINHGATSTQLKGVYIPTFPSSLLSGEEFTSPPTPPPPVKFVDDNTIYHDYQTTIMRLRNIQRNTNNQLMAEPKIKIAEDGLVVGVLTETNQFIQLSRPTTVEDTFSTDGETPLKIVNSSNYLVADKTLNMSSNGDVERETTIKNIYFENQFYLMFRSAIRLFFGKYENRKYVAQIQDIIDDDGLMFKEKLGIIVRLLKETAGKTIRFDKMDDKMMINIVECLQKKTDEDGAVAQTENKPHAYCMSNTGSLIIPQNNLVSGYDNSTLYYTKMADELVRYTRIRLFMFQPKYFLNIPSQTYKINRNEFLVLQSLLTNEYFKDIQKFNSATEIRNTDYYFAEPAASNENAPYSNKITREELEKVEEDKNPEIGEAQKEKNVYYCQDGIRGVVGSWQLEFASNDKTKEIVFKNTVVCSYSAIIYILQQRTRQKMNEENAEKNGLQPNAEIDNNITVQLVRRILWNGYLKYISNDKYFKKILHTLKKQGKVDLIERVEKGIVSLETVIFSEDYYITDLDYWIISTETHTPIVLFNSTILKNTVENVKWLFLGGGNIYDDMYFVRSPALVKRNETPKYSIITPCFKYTELKELKEQIQGIIDGKDDNTANVTTLVDFLKS